MKSGYFTIDSSNWNKAQIASVLKVGSSLGKLTP
jgi:hypothetical protein